MVFILFPRDSLKTVYDVLDVILEGIHSKQEVSPPGLADTVCPRGPLMTQVQH